MRQLFALLLAIIAISFARGARAEAGAPAEAALPPVPVPVPPVAGVPTVDLYTVGPHNELPSRLGHAVICVRPAGHDDVEHGQCYDYGVPEGEDFFAAAWASVRNAPSFRPILVAEGTVVHFFQETQGRQLEKQRLPLSAEETTTLVTSLDRDVQDAVAYAYHPYWANCSTKIRDRIDAATGGKLHGVPTTLPPTTLREYAEEGHSGHVAELTAMALFLGEGNDKVPTPWEAMLLPVVLRDAVTERFGVKPEQVSERLAVILPTSPALGKLTLVVAAFLLFFVVRLCARTKRLPLALGIVGGSLGLLALLVEAFAALVEWSEVSHNWALLLFLPTDFALPWMARSKALNGKLLPRYLQGRVGVALLLAVFEIVGLAHQPLLPLVALVVVPFVGLLGALKERVVAEESAEAPPAAKAV